MHAPLRRVALVAWAPFALSAGCAPSDAPAEALPATEDAIATDAPTDAPPDAPPGDAEPGARPAVTDDGGRKVVRSEPAQRIVSAVPALTEVVQLLAPEGVLVGRTRFDRAPELAHLPVVGGSLDPSVERLASLEPDLVIVWWGAGGDDAALQLESLDIPVYRARVETLDDLRRHVRHLGVLLGRPDSAEAIVQGIDDGLRRVAASVAGREPVGVFYALWPDPPATAGGGTFVDDVIERAGGRNVFGDARGAWPEVSLEAIVRRAPEAIVIPAEAGGAGDLAWLRAAGWRDLPAVREGRYLVVDADLFNRPGPNVVEAARRLARFLHGVGS